MCGLMYPIISQVIVNSWIAVALCIVWDCLHSEVICYFLIVFNNLTVCRTIVLL